ncbi:hypothetical protein GGP41_007843 [Bipolaris sorokiniana]|uniref:Kinesin light chain n=1 Tax=Cochliobolus sativus TaxID=45130 RepID=A0A8H5ZKT6_COCSA|nr:hypothetical protein GGP41_007843 [Bipolaris sorokiniana]
METKKRVLGEEHPDTLINMANLAHMWKSQSRSEEAIASSYSTGSLAVTILTQRFPSKLNAVAKRELKGRSLMLLLCY